MIGTLMHEMEIQTYDVSTHVYILIIHISDVKVQWKEKYERFNEKNQLS